MYSLDQLMYLGLIIGTCRYWYDPTAVHLYRYYYVYYL